MLGGKIFLCSTVSGRKILRRNTYWELIKKMFTNYLVFEVTNIRKLL